MLERVREYKNKVIYFDDVYKSIAYSKACRELLYWGYMMEVSLKLIHPIELAPDKQDFWELSKEYLTDKEERIRFCKALYYLSV
jgi:hypothetical protein